MTLHNAHAYCDESGNTGANLLDPNQPILMVGGWVINDDYIETAESIVSKYNRLLKPRANELHGVQLLKSEIGTRAILHLIHDLCELNCLPVCQFAEKRFRLAGHVIEVFLAPESNPYIPKSFDFKDKGKPELADKIYSLPDELLVEFAEAYVTVDRSLLLDSLRNIATALSLRLETKLADLMLGSLPNIDIIVEEIKDGRARFPSNTLTAPNLSAFHMLFQYLESFGRMGGIEKISIVHDESKQFSTTFRMVFEAYRDVPPAVIKRGPFRNEYFGFESVKDLTFADSKKSPLLQAADVLISTMYRFATNIYRGSPNPTGLMDIAKLLLEVPLRYPVIIRTTMSKRYLDNLYDSVNVK